MGGRPCGCRKTDMGDLERTGQHTLVGLRGQENRLVWKQTNKHVWLCGYRKTDMVAHGWTGKQTWVAVSGQEIDMGGHLGTGKQPKQTWIALRGHENIHGWRQKKGHVGLC